MKTMIRNFLKVEAASGVILFIAAFVAIAIANSPFSEFYQQLFHSRIEIKMGHWFIDKPFLFWVNEGLMTLFFLLVGLELKREFLTGEIKGFSKIILPGTAAFGGMFFPAVIYTLFNFSLPTAKGWPIPVATDIAFALGLLSLFGRRVPLGLKLFLMALAIFDDIGAIIIIVIYHTQHISFVSLVYVGLIMSILLAMNRFPIRFVWPYLLLGIFLWIFLLSSGIHPTVSGVLLAFMIPLRDKKRPIKTKLEEKLHPWVAFLIMPLFALANAGVSFHGLTLEYWADPLLLGVVVGLFIGKQVGVFSFAWVLIRLGWAKLPNYSSWLELYGVACICGIGFTMSLFLGTLAFQEDNAIYLIKVRLGVLTGSVLSGLIGALILYLAGLKKEKIGGRKLETP